MSTQSQGWRTREWIVVAALLALFALAMADRFAPPAVAADDATVGETVEQVEHPVQEGDAPHNDADARGEDHGHGGVPDVHVLWILPFALLLGSIAIMPLINMHFWEHNYPWFAFVLGSITAIYYMFFFPDLDASRHAWLHEMQEYVSFIALLGSLYIVSGGIMLNIQRKPTPFTNTMILLVGALIANVFGTTGAAILLIRPFIRMNRAHIKPYHIVFFIFSVANCGGCLTPIGDPPLFMGYLKGVPFFWVLKACWPMWALCVALLLVLFFIVDTLDARKRPPVEDADAATEHKAGGRTEIFGAQNFLFIGLILLGVFQPSMFEVWREGHYLQLPLSREILMAIAAVASKLTTKPFIYERNEFTYGPIKEVAILFVAIFSTMVPALNYLNRHSDQMPLNTAGQYYFITGTLSSMLDNAPTYLVFLETKRGSINKQYASELATIRLAMDNMAEKIELSRGLLRGEYVRSHPSAEGKSSEEYEAQVNLAVDEMEAAVDQLIIYHPREVKTGTVTDAQINLAFLIGHPVMGLFLVAISVGAVFFGAATYIGNGPNFMVKSIAESSGIQMPSFFGYVVKYTLPFLAPILIVIWLVFFLT